MYGKTLQNNRTHLNMLLVTNREQALRLTSRPTYMRSVIHSENLVSMLFRPKALTTSKPIYAGTTVLDHSKHLMFDFYYNTVKADLGWENTLCLASDTDSLKLFVKHSNIYNYMRDNVLSNSPKFDISNFHHQHELFISAEPNQQKMLYKYAKENKKVVGLMSDEGSGVPISDFIGLRAKLYSQIDVNGESKRRAKGVKRSITKNRLTHEDYEKCLAQVSVKSVSSHNLIAQNHRIYLMKNNKIALSSYDDKRWLKDPVSSYAYGHFMIENDCM